MTSHPQTEEHCVYTGFGLTFAKEIDLQSGIKQGHTRAMKNSLGIRQRIYQFNEIQTLRIRSQT